MNSNMARAESRIANTSPQAAGKSLQWGSCALLPNRIPSTDLQLRRGNPIGNWVGHVSAREFTDVTTAIY
jgi:hypothetical protein